MDRNRGLIRWGVLGGASVEPETERLQQGVPHNAKVHRRFAGLSPPVVGWDLADFIIQVMGPNNNFREDEKGSRPQGHAGKKFTRPGLGPVVIIHPQLEKEIQKKDINDGDKEAPQLVGVPLPADPQDQIRMLESGIEKEVDKGGQLGAVKFLIGPDIHQVSPAGPLDPILQRRGVPHVFFMKDEMISGVFLNFLLKDLPGIILAAVLDHDHFCLPLGMAG